VEAAPVEIHLKAQMNAEERGDQGPGIREKPRLPAINPDSNGKSAVMRRDLL
jgi:hypothetical protein